MLYIHYKLELMYFSSAVSYVILPVRQPLLVV